MAGLILEVIDSFPRFLSVWGKIKSTDIKERPAVWEKEYMQYYPELLQKQIEDYDQQGIDWREIAEEKVFPYLEDRFLAMYDARDNIKEILPGIIANFERAMDRSVHACLVLYVGLGCGAGWVSRYRGKPAILMGLENIAECGWEGKEALQGLIAHELGHLYQYQVRGNMEDEGNPFLQLYREGFAHWTEKYLLERDFWHVETGINPPGWEEWCEKNFPFLARRFLQTVREKGEAAEFFGHWKGVSGWKSCGFYLGYRFVSGLYEKGYSLEEIAGMDEVEKRVQKFLEVAMQGDNNGS